MGTLRFISVISMLCVVIGVGSGCSKGSSDGDRGKNTMGIKQSDDLSAQALAILNEKCVVCHGTERFEKAEFTPEQWNQVIDRMVAKGAKLSGDEMDVLRHWGDAM